MRSLISASKLTIFLLACLVMILIFAANRLFFSICFKNSKKFYNPHQLFGKIICKIYGLHITLKGNIAHHDQIIYVSNHLSYIDIPIIITALPGTFVSKADVRQWPIFGILARLSQTVFIERHRGAVESSLTHIKRALNNNRPLIIFPEGTSTNGADVLPFKSSLFSLFLNSHLKENTHIQPFTISLLTVNNKPVTTDADRDLYAYHSDMTLLPHLWRLGKTSGAQVQLDFHTPLKARDYNGRKALAQAAYKIVRGGLHIPS